MNVVGALLRGFGPLLLAVGFAFWFDRELHRRGLAPPGFAAPSRRAVATALLAIGLWITVFAGLGSLGADAPPVDVSQLSRLDLFATHLLLAFILLGWYALGHLGLAGAAASAAVEAPPAVGPSLDDVEARPSRRFPAAVGLLTPSPAGDLGLGLVAGVGIWLAVIVAMVLAALVVATLGGEDLLPKQAPALVPWLVAQPVLLRLAIACSAGFFEELFFRGFLEPRIGVTGATIAFVLAHLAYDQPWMLLGVTLLSLSFSALTRWRQTILPAIVAHTVFDAIQLLVVIPALLDPLGGGLPVARIH